MKPMRLVSNYGFNKQHIEWNFMTEEDMSGLLPESLEVLRLILEANKRLLERWLGTLFGFVVHGSLSREINKVVFLKDGMEEP